MRLCSICTKAYGWGGLFQNAHIPTPYEYIKYMSKLYTYICAYICIQVISQRCHEIHPFVVTFHIHTYVGTTVRIIVHSILILKHKCKLHSKNNTTTCADLSMFTYAYTICICVFRKYYMYINICMRLKCIIINTGTNNRI